MSPKVATSVRWFGSSKIIFKERVKEVQAAGIYDGDDQRGSRFAKKTIEMISKISGNVNLYPIKHSGNIREANYTVPASMKRKIKYSVEENNGSTVLIIHDAGCY